MDELTQEKDAENTIIALSESKTTDVSINDKQKAVALIENKITNTKKKLERSKRKLEKLGMKSEYDNFVVALSDEEKELIEQHRERKKKFPDSPIVIESKFDDNDNFVGHSYENREGYSLSDLDKYLLWSTALTAATGVTHQGFSSKIFTLCASACGISSANESSGTELTNIINAMQALKPQDEIEGMLISRLISLHYQSMKYSAFASYDKQTTVSIDLNINRSTKLFRLYNETLEALMRYRRKGEQKVIVQHVNVNDGGQAIVGGNMAMGTGGNNKK